MELHLTDSLNDEELAAIERYKRKVSWLLAALALIAFFMGLQYLDERLFYHRFSISRHVIIEQNPDTYEIYAWRDVFGRVYTPADPHVRYFPFAASALVLFLLGIFLGLYCLLTNNYKMSLLIEKLLPSRFPGLE